MKKILFPILVVILFSISSNAQIVEKENINWLSFKQVDSLFKITQKPIIINFYANDNDSSRLMFDSIFHDKNIVSYINTAFYAINFDVYSKDTITFFDGTKMYNQNKTKKSYHDFVIKILGTNPYFPSFICFSKQAEGAVYNWYHSVNRMFSVLIFYNEEAYKTTTYENYNRYFAKTYPENSKTGYSMVHVTVHWLGLKEALDRNKTNPKKVFLDLNVNWRNTCSIMAMTTYSDKKISDILNQYYYPVQLTATTKDTLDVFDKVYVNDGKLNGFHQLPVALLNGKMVFPSLLFFDENSKLVGVIQNYYTPEDLEPILLFYAQDAYKTTDWNKFLTDFKKGKSESKN